MFNFKNQFPPYDLGARWYKLTIEIKDVEGSKVPTIVDADLPFYNDTEADYPSEVIGMAALGIYSGSAFAFTNAKVYDVIFDIDADAYEAYSGMNINVFEMSRVQYMNYAGTRFVTIGMPGSPYSFAEKFSLYVLASCIDKDAVADPTEF